MDEQQAQTEFNAYAENLSATDDMPTTVVSTPIFLENSPAAEPTLAPITDMALDSSIDETVESVTAEGPELDFDFDDATLVTEIPKFSEPPPASAALDNTGEDQYLRTYGHMPAHSAGRVITSALATPSSRPEPIMRPRQKEEINFWPLIIGFTGLLGLLTLYVFFNPIIVQPGQDRGINSDSRIGNAIELLSNRPASNSSDSESSGDGNSGLVTGEVTGNLTGQVAGVDEKYTEIDARDANSDAVKEPTSARFISEDIDTNISEIEENPEGGNIGGTNIDASTGDASTGDVNTGDSRLTDNAADAENNQLDITTALPNSGNSDNANNGVLPVVTATPLPTFTQLATSTPANIVVPGDTAVPTAVAVTEATGNPDASAGTTDSTTNAGAESLSNDTTNQSQESGAPSQVNELPANVPTPTSTPPLGGRIVSIKPQLDNAGWWSSDDLERNHLGDSFLYVGRFEEREYISAIRYDLREIARGADILEATLQLTGLRADRFNPDLDAIWRLELIAEKDFSGFSRANFLTARSAVAAFQVNPTVSARELTADGTLAWQLTQEMRVWLRQQIIDGARSVILRIQADINEGETLYAWDTGQGSQTRDNPPWLVMSVGRAPETPPALATRPYIVATSTPAPKNLLTVVAVNQEATSVAQSIGTYTPVPYDIVTPTSYPQNLATVQAGALDRGLPPVILPTRALSNPEERAAAAQYATAVALTTGTFTPVPENYVTPQLILPSPIALNVATTVARTAVAESQAQVQTPTPLPYNALIAEYVIATVLPVNSATEEARRVIAQAMAQATGTSTPLPWHVVVVSPTPTPLPTLPPTITPTPFLFNADGFQPTPLPQPPGQEIVPDTLPGQLRRKILFKSDRVNGQVEILALDPVTGQTFVVNLPWAHDVARRFIARSPDGQREAAISTSGNGPQIKIVSYENGQARDISTGEIFGYDTAWSPSGGLIAYVSHVSGGDEIYVMNTDGSAPRPLTNSPNFEVKHPTWWNGQIVYHSNQTGRRQLWVMNADGSNARILATSDANDFEPIYVP